MNQTSDLPNGYLKNRKISKALSELVQIFDLKDGNKFYWYKSVYEHKEQLHFVLLFHDDIVNFSNCIKQYYKPNLHKQIIISFGTESMFCFNSVDNKKFYNLFELLHLWLVDCNIHPSIVSFQNGNQLINKAYTEWCKDHNIKDKITMGWYDLWAKSTIHTHMGLIDKLQHDNKKKHFCCLNNKPRWHRLKVLEYLHDNNLLQHGSCSFVFNDDAKNILKDNFNREDLVKYIPMCRDGWNTCKDIKMPSNMKYIQDVPELDSYFSYFNETCFDVITETIFNSNDWFHTKHGLQENYWHNIFFTEKTWRSVLFKRPFVLLGGAGSLETLRQHGFKTFDILFNEDYDTITDPEKRLSSAMDSVNNVIEKYSVSQLQDFINSKDMQSILNHNYENLFVYAEQHKNKISHDNWKNLSWETHPINPTFQGFDND